MLFFCTKTQILKGLPRSVHFVSNGLQCESILVPHKQLRIDPGAVEAGAQVRASKSTSFYILTDERIDFPFQTARCRFQKEAEEMVVAKKRWKSLLSSCRGKNEIDIDQ